jgi:hypothetical protein
VSWARVDDGLFEHPKFADLSDRAKLLFIASLVYGNKHLTEGIISASGLRIVKAWARGSNRHVGELVGTGLWELTIDGHLVHDWHHYNQPAAVIKARRAAARDRMARARSGVRSREQDDEQDAPVRVSHTPTHNNTPSSTPSPNSGSSHPDSVIQEKNEITTAYRKGALR